MHYFPQPDSPEIASFVHAFVRLMFAHAEFERRIRDLQGVITGCQKFGEQPKNQWGARKRSELMAKLIVENKERIGELPEADQIARALDAAIVHSDRRNLLAHGTWWRFDPEQQVITVRSGTDWPDQEQHIELSVDDIDRAAEALLDLEVELDRLQASIRERLAQEGLSDGKNI